MIKIKGDLVEIQGKGADIAQELSALINVVREEQPEMLLGVLTAWTPLLEKDIPTADKKIVAGLAKLVQHWIKLNEVE